MKEKASIKKQQIIDTAIRLFDRNSFHGVGINQIITEADVAKATFYNYFNSKEDLVVEVLENYRELTLDNLRKHLDQYPKPAINKLIYTFDILEEKLNNNSFSGSIFVKATGEYPEKFGPIHQQILLYKELSIAFLETLTRAANLNSPKKLARQIQLLHEGTIASAHISGNYKVARSAKSIAIQMIKQAE